MKYLKSVNCLNCRKNEFKILFPSTLTPKDFNPKIIQEDLKNTLGNYKKHSRIVKCKNCGLVYTNPMEDIPKLMKGYKDVVDDEYLATEKYRKVLSSKHLEKMQKYTKKGKILDIGCFAGYFLELARKEGWEGYGIEPSVWASDIAKKRKVKIISKNIENAKLQRNFYDAITMWDVIEHLADPKKIIAKSYKSLKKGGIIAMGTPNIDSLVAKILRNNNPYILRMHLTFFSPKTLGEMMQEEGFEIVKVYSYGRIFPVSYILDRVETDLKIYHSFKNFIKKYPLIANREINLNLADSFTIIGRK